MSRLSLLLLLAIGCSSTPSINDPVREGDEVTIKPSELEPVGQFFLETRRLLVADFIRIEMTPQFFEERMGFTRDPRYVERTSWRDKNGTRVIQLKNVHTAQTTNIDPDLLPRVYFGTGFEARAYRSIRIYLRVPESRERPISIMIVGKSDPSDAKLWTSGRLQHERPTLTINSALIWSEYRESYVHKSSIG
jgi:hypothetical protein